MANNTEQKEGLEAMEVVDELQTDSEQVEMNDELGKSVDDTNEPNTEHMNSIKNFKPTTIIVAIIIVFAGVGSGYFLSQASGSGSSQATSPTRAATGDIEVEMNTIYGSQDEALFSDNAEGVLVKGGIGGEGSHRILRPGGKDQTVYLTSSIVDLDLFVDHKVQIWGETFDAQKAGWLMDVGRVKVIELNAEKPFEEDL